MKQPTASTAMPNSAPKSSRSPQKLGYALVPSKIKQRLEETVRRKSRNRLDSLYPDKGPLRRELYPKHLQFFAAGRAHQERCMMAANRVGKTFGVGGYETTLHLTGRYPDWWEGRRFAGPIDAWVAGDTAETTRDIVQAALMGPPAGLGTGLIPADTIIGEPSRRAGVTGAFDTARVRSRVGRHQPARVQVLRPGPPEIPGHREARGVARRGTAGGRLRRMHAAADDDRRADAVHLHAAQRDDRNRAAVHAAACAANLSGRI